jgi:uncharacterized membrane protein YphA (DoxX/SURF4 family)
MNEKILLLIRIIVGIVFIFSATSKLKSVGLFEITLIDQGITTDRMTAACLSRILISFELFLGTAFLQPFLLRKIVAPLTIFLLTVFSIYLLYLMIYSGHNENCGCFGEVVKMSPWESLLKNLVLIGLVLYLFVKIKSVREKWLIPATMLVGSFILIFTVFPMRSLADNVFSTYTHFEQQGRVDLTQGDRLVAVMDVSCEHCQAAARELGELDRNTHKLPPTYFLLFAEDEDSNSVEHFFHLTNTGYPYYLISVDEFFDLIGSTPPRVYWLQDGKIEAQWDENLIENLTSAFKIEKYGGDAQ